MVVVSKINRIFRRDAFLMQFLPALVVFGMLFLFALVNWQNSVRSLHEQYQEAVEKRVQLLEGRLEERMQTGGTLVRAGSSKLYSSHDVTFAEWQNFYSQISGEENFRAGVVGYAPMVLADQKTDFEETMRQNGISTSIDGNSNSAVYFPIQYVTKFDHNESSNYGLDLYSQDNYKSVMDAARDSGNIRMTEFVKYDSKNAGGVVIFMPEYHSGMPVTTVEERRAALNGFVFETISFEKLFEGVVDKKDEKTFGFVLSELTNNNQARQIYRSKTVETLTSKGLPVVSKREINEYGRKWQLYYFASDNILSPVELTRPVNILGVGLGLAFIASLLVFLLIKYRTGLFAIAEEQKLQKAKDELLSLASHQLRTPATGVKQYVGMVLDGFGGPVPKAQARLLEQAYKSNERQLQIINDFLYVAKLGSGSLTTTRRKFDFALLVRDVIEEMDIDIKEKKHVIRTKIPKTLIIKADEHSVRMIIENLISNAAKYTKPGGKINIEIKTTSREVTLSVRDNGVGISKQEQKLLFKQFSRIPNELTNEVGGSGIGLYLAQQLAVRNGGKIAVNSEPLKGSTFTLYLPNWHVKKITIRGRNT